MIYNYHQSNGPLIKIGWCTLNWAFMLLVDNFPNLIAWKEAWATPGSVIKNANGVAVLPEDMETIITLRQGDRAYLINALEHGDFLTRDKIVEGNHNLIRRIIGIQDGEYRCVGNEDCYDLAKLRV